MGCHKTSTSLAEIKEHQIKEHQALCNQSRVKRNRSESLGQSNAKVMQKEHASQKEKSEDKQLTCGYCNLSMSKGAYIEHRKKCEYRQLTCVYCDEFMFINKYIEHYQECIGQSAKQYEKLLETYGEKFVNRCCDQYDKDNVCGLYNYRNSWCGEAKYLINEEKIIHVINDTKEQSMAREKVKIIYTLNLLLDKLDES